MALFRRRRPDPALDEVRAAFGTVAAHVDAAQRSLLAAIPTSRDEGIPLAQALAAFNDNIGRAAAGMAAWREDRVLHEWTRCEDALRAAREEAERLRLEPRVLEFEELNGRVGDVLHPLEEFADVERALRRR